jgi:hypothetical protein
MGGCCARFLPLDATCAREARQVYRKAAAVLGLAGDVVYDGMTMVSELAANTVHALDNIEVDADAGFPLAGAPELWIYLRHSPDRWELVCKVFDSAGGWRQGEPAAGLGGAPPPGRGLQIVAALSGGRWGYHPTRSRLGGWKVPGKAVWFAQPVPGALVPRCLLRSRIAPHRAARALEAMLAGRGLGWHLLRADEPAAAISVLSVRPGLTVWCRDQVICWRTRDGGYERRVPTDLIDAAEKIVCTCEEMAGR